jgi:Arc/MetJ-type ribon-helix-helix transcriptional regulator
MHSFTVTLPEKAVVMIDQLIGIGLHGSSRAEVARTLILNRLEQLAGPGLISFESQRDS